MARILVVEDNALNIKLFCDLLNAHGHETEPVTDSREALEAARAFKPDLVITDIQLPYVTGIELMELLRADDELKDVPIMAVTAYAAAGDDEMLRLGNCLEADRHCAFIEAVCDEPALRVEEVAHHIRHAA